MVTVEQEHEDVLCWLSVRCQSVEVPTALKHITTTQSTARFFQPIGTKPADPPGWSLNLVIKET